MKRAVCVWLVAAPGLWCGCQKADPAIPASAWQGYSAPDGKFSVALPGSPRSSESNGYQRLEVQPQGSAPTFSVDYADLPPGFIQSPSQYFEEYRTKTIPQSFGDGKVVSVRDVSAGDNPGKEFILEFPSTKGSLFRRLFIVKNRLYILSVAGTKLDPAAPDVRKFFDSFNIK